MADWIRTRVLVANALLWSSSARYALSGAKAALIL